VAAALGFTRAKEYGKRGLVGTSVLLVRMCKPRSLRRMVLRLNKRLNTQLDYTRRDEYKCVEWVAFLYDSFVVVYVMFYLSILLGRLSPMD
jgi:hypothetical protein